MNKSLFWAGLGFQIAQLLLIGIYMLSTLDYSWLTLGLVFKAVLISLVVLVNLASIIFMLVGTFKDD